MFVTPVKKGCAMNFSVLPPEVNSARMYVGAGSGPMLAAAAAWDGLAGELGSAAASFGSVTSGLAGGSWQGAASAAMTAVAAHYVGFLNAAATQAGGAAAQTKAAAAAFEGARAATVHPAMVAANRTNLVSLVTSNLFGQNAPAIAATEANYEQMWAQDVEAMAGYHAGASAAAAQLSPALQALHGLATRLAGVLGLNPVVNPVPGNPDLMSQTLNVGPLSITSFADTGNNFDAAVFSTPLFTGTFTSGAEPALGLGETGHTLIAFQSPVFPALNSEIALPFTDPLSPLFAALLPLNF
jgi:PPE-repeat protein